MADVHETIEERWLQSPDLLAAVPADQMGVGQFPYGDGSVRYPYVCRMIQSEDKEYRSSDGKALNATVEFKTYSPVHADGNRVRKLMWGAFDNLGWQGPLKIIKARETSYGELQEPSGLWQFMALWEFVYEVRNP